MLAEEGLLTKEERLAAQHEGAADYGALYKGAVCHAQKGVLPFFL